MNLIDFQQHLKNDTSPFLLRKKDHRPSIEDEEMHKAVYDRSPAVYALSALGPDVQSGQATRVMFQLLKEGTRGLPSDARTKINRTLDVLLTSLPADNVLTVFLALKKIRVNRKTLSRLIIRYIFNHPQVYDLVKKRRKTVVDCLEHALGRDVARGCASVVAGKSNDEGYLRRNLLRFVDYPDLTRGIFNFLYQNGQLPATARGNYAAYHQRFLPKGEDRGARPRTVTATNRGDIAATLVHLYRGGQTPELLQALDAYADRCADQIPRFDGTISLVLDASASTHGYGEREFACISQSVALKMVIERCCERFFLHQIGGSADTPPLPEDSTDMASAVLDAVEDGPDLIAIVSDGYENRLSGDLARIVNSFTEIGVNIPLIFCHSTFTDKDDLERRRPAPNLRELRFWHEDEFPDICLNLFAYADPSVEERFIDKKQTDMLASREEEVTSWTVPL